MITFTPSDIAQAAGTVAVAAPVDRSLVTRPTPEVCVQNAVAKWLRTYTTDASGRVHRVTLLKSLCGNCGRPSLPNDVEPLHPAGWRVICARCYEVSLEVELVPAREFGL